MSSVERRYPRETWRPTRARVAAIAESFGLTLDGPGLDAVHRAVHQILDRYDVVDSIPAPAILPRALARPSRRPSPEENPLGAWYFKCQIDGQSGGILSDKRVVVKDNICVANIPMMNGSRLLSGFVPDVDATVVSRVLAHGGSIVGKAVCEDLCHCGASFTAGTGPVRNPYDRNRSSGGSSSGAAVLVATGEADMAIGGDQGGSIRGPSSWSGICGLKPTYGLVPYTGAFPFEVTLDHLGPMARTASDVALLLEAIAGPDGLDPRQVLGTEPERYSQVLDIPVEGLRIGILSEGFGWSGVSEADVDVLVRSSISSMASTLGCVVDEVSIPEHRTGIEIFAPIIAEGTANSVTIGSPNNRSYTTLDLAERFRRALVEDPNLLPLTAKVRVIAGRYAQQSTGGYLYAKAQNLAIGLGDIYDSALRDFDVLAMPTTPMKAPLLPRAALPADEHVAATSGMSQNNCPFNLTGHPAISLPCAMSVGLPVGLMLVGRRGRDADLLRLAHQFQVSVFPPPSPGN
jgi:amidase